MINVLLLFPFLFPLNPQVAIKPPEIIQTISIPEIEQVVEPTIEPIEPVKDPIECSCVQYAQSLSPDIPLWDAIDYPVNTINPQVGDVIKLQYYNATTTRYTYHIALIEKITEEGYEIKEANYEKCKTSSRIIPKDDDNIVGFFDVALWREIKKLPQEIYDTLYCESRFTQYKQGAVLRGDAGEWGIGQYMKGTWKWFTELRQKEHLKTLDILNPYDQLTMTEWAFENGFQSHWSCYKLGNP